VGATEALVRVLAGYHGAGCEQLGGSRASWGEFTRDCAGKGESSRAFSAQVIAQALWLLTKAEDETSSSAFLDWRLACGPTM
jgi:hypothetical protein